MHDEAPAASETDWPQILALDEVLSQVAPGPVVTLSLAVALAMVHGPKAGLALLGELGDAVAARESYLRAARMTVSAPEQRSLALRAARLRQPGAPLAAGPAACQRVPRESGSRTGPAG